MYIKLYAVIEISARGTVLHLLACISDLYKGDFKTECIQYPLCIYAMKLYE